jgi:LuxR family maltose regulon positive regulatory protein
VRTFVDLGLPLLPVLREIADGGVVTVYLERVLAAAVAPTAPQKRLAPVGPAPYLPELLTRRETEILALLARRWSDKEIAARLVITSNTVRKHTSTIYHKLGVHRRREAVATAQALGLLPAA